MAAAFSAISGGWRIPFLASAALVVIGIVIRLKLDESPELLRARRVPGAQGLFTGSIVAALCVAVATGPYGAHVNEAFPAEKDPAV